MPVPPRFQKRRTAARPFVESVKDTMKQLERELSEASSTAEQSVRKATVEVRTAAADEVRRVVQQAPSGAVRAVQDKAKELKKKRKPRAPGDDAAIEAAQRVDRQQPSQTTTAPQAAIEAQPPDATGPEPALVPMPVATIAPTIDREVLRQLLYNRDTARQALALRVILGPPKALLE